MLTIEKGVPIATGRNRHAGLATILARMDVGDSIFVDESKQRMAAGGYADKLGIKITSKKEGDGYRIWRIE